MRQQKVISAHVYCLVCYTPIFIYTHTGRLYTGIFAAIYVHPYTGKTRHKYTTVCSPRHVHHLAIHCLDSSPCKTQDIHTQRYGDIRAPAIYEHTCHDTKTPPIHHTLPLAPHHSSHTSTSPPPLTTPERFPNAPLHPDGSLR